jgi:hypothetical protein
LARAAVSDIELAMANSEVLTSSFQRRPAVGPRPCHNFPAIAEPLSPGGALAVQVPSNIDALHRIARSLAARPRARSIPASGVREWHVHEPSFYYDLAGTARGADRSLNGIPR